MVLRIKTFLCSQIDNNKMNQLFDNIKFDIIIDDGSHITLHQLKSLGYLYKKVKKMVFIYAKIFILH